MANLPLSQLYSRKVELHHSGDAAHMRKSSKASCDTDSTSASVRHQEGSPCFSSDTEYLIAHQEQDGDSDSDSEDSDAESGTFIGRLPSTSTTHSRCLYSEPAQTLLFLDWDDTLFPTSELLDHWGIPPDSSQWGDFNFTQAQLSALESWQLALRDYLTTACGLSGRCAVVTNAKRPWVEDCVAYFAPDLQSFFEPGSGAVHVVYAREAYAATTRSRRESLVPAVNSDGCGPEALHDRLVAWKFAAMEREAQDFYAQYPGQSWKNIVSQGDAHYELHAVQDLAFRRQNGIRDQLRTKAVLVQAQPSLGSLALSLRTWKLLLPALVCFDGDVDLDLQVAPDFATAIGDALGFDVNLAALPGAALWNRPAAAWQPTAEENDLATVLLDELAMVVMEHLVG